MPYTPTNWTNEIPQSTPLKYRIVRDVGGLLTDSATIELVTPVTAGTPINAANLNKLENALVDHDGRIGVLEDKAGVWTPVALSGPAGWVNSPKAANTTNIVDAVVDFGVPTGAKAVIVRLAAYFQNSHATNAYASVETYLRNNPCVWVQGHYYGNQYVNTGVVPLNERKFVVVVGGIPITSATLTISAYLL